MKHKNAALSSQFVESVFTPLSLVLISIVAIIAVAVALLQVNKGPIAPTAPQSFPQAADFSNSTCSLPFTVEQSDLRLTKSADHSTANIGDQVTYTINVFNAGPTQATGVTVLDLLPAGLTYVSTVPANVYNSTTGIWTIGTIAVNQTVTLKITVTVAAAGTIDNIAQVQTSNQPDPNSTPGNSVPTEDDQDHVVLNSTNPEADLELTKRANTLAPTIGTDVTFTLDLMNKGPQQATTVTVKDVLPVGLTYKSSSATKGSYNPTTGIWTVGTVAVNATESLTMIVTVSGTGSLTNYTQVQTSDQPDTDSTPGDNSTTQDDDDTLVIISQPLPTPTPTNTVAPSGTLIPTATPTPVADLSLTKRASNSTPKIGDTITYTIDVNNAGPDQATGVVVREPLTGGLSYVTGSAVATQGSYDIATGLWTIGTIPANQTRTLTLRVVVNVSGTITNTAQVQNSDQKDPDSSPGNNNPNEDDQQSSTINPVTQGADLDLVKRVNISRPAIGQEIVYTLQLHNAGPLQADNVTVREAIPQGTTFIKAEPSQGSYDPATGIWNVGSIAKDAIKTVQLTVRIDTATQIVNVAEVMTSSQPDPDSTPGNNNSSEDDQDDAVVLPVSNPVLPKAGNTSKTTLFVIATGVIVLIIGAMGLLLLL